MNVKFVFFRNMYNFAWEEFVNIERYVVSESLTNICGNNKVKGNSLQKRAEKFVT